MAGRNEPTEGSIKKLEPRQHLTRDELKAWQAGKASGELKQRILTHLEACPDCRRLLAVVTGPAPRRVRDALQGTMAGRFKLEERLGQGGMGAVYAAFEQPGGRRVAVKVLLSHLEDDDTNLARFRAEVRSLAAVSHPNVVKLLDSGELESGGQYFVMEHLEGETLAERIKRGPVPLDEGLELWLQACTGLAAVHRVGMLHRDIKPGNLFLCRTGLLKLFDFGLARASESTQLTSAGLLMGTVGFVAPELAEGEQASVSTDLYALGVSFWRVLSRTDPFPGKSLQERLRAQLTAEPPKLRKVLPEAPAALEALMTSLLSRDASQRPATAQDVMVRLAELVPDDADDDAPTQIELRPGPRGNVQTATVKSASKAPGTPTSVSRALPEKKR